jgi:hypothetical protein
VAFVALTSTALAAVPRLINYQGALSDTRGVAIEGPHTLTFSFYSSTGAGASPLWREVHRSIDVKDGLFHVVLGSVNPILDETFASGQLWIGISVDNDPEIEPRMQMTAVPWAVRAAIADAVVGGCGHAETTLPQSPPGWEERELLSQQESEMLRADFLGICALYEDLGSLMGNEALQMVGYEARLEFEDLDWEQLSIFRDERESVSNLRSILSDFYGQALLAMPEGGDPGSPLTPGLPDADYWPLYGSDRNNPTAMFVARLIVKTAQGVWSGLSRGCEEVAFGFNLSLACIPVDWVLFGAEEVFDQFGEKDSDIDSAEIEGTYERVGHIHGDIELVQDTVDILDGKLDALLILVEQLRETNCEIIKLLHTPQGQRTSDVLPCADQPGYPYEWGED